GEIGTYELPQHTRVISGRAGARGYPGLGAPAAWPDRHVRRAIAVQFRGLLLPAGSLRPAPGLGSRARRRRALPRRGGRPAAAARALGGRAPAARRTGGPLAARGLPLRGALALGRQRAPASRCRLAGLTG